MDRAKTPSFIISLALDTKPYSKEFLEKMYYAAFKVYNQLIKFAKKEYAKLLLDFEYKGSSGSKRTAIIKKYKLSTYDFEAYGKVLQKKYSKYLGSHIVQKLCARVAASVKAVLYKGGKQLHFKKLNDITTLEGKNNETALRFIDNQLIIGNFKINIKERDLKNPFYQEALKHRVKYCRLIRKPFNKGFRYYVELVLEGTSPRKDIIGEGYSGIDIGTSTIANTSKDSCLLEELAPKAKDYDKEIADIQRHMDNSKRASNPQNYNKNGTIKKGKKTWTYSKTYYKLLWKLKATYRKKSAYIKQSHNILAKKIIANCNVIYTEKMNFKALAKKSKETKRQEKVSSIQKKDGTVIEVHKYKKKKRFGKSITNRAPSQLMNTIKKKLTSQGGFFYEVNTQKFKASQYNHIEDKCIPKKLYERSQIINNQWIQRDLYSSFLLMNSNDNLETPNRDKCIESFDKFLENHNKCIKENKDKPHPKSFGF